jgi:hypothetical protein
MNISKKDKLEKSNVQLDITIKFINNKNPIKSMMIKIKFKMTSSKPNFCRISLYKMKIMQIMNRSNKNFKKDLNQVKFIKTML